MRVNGRRRWCFNLAMVTCLVWLLVLHPGKRDLAMGMPNAANPPVSRGPSENSVLLLGLKTNAALIREPSVKDEEAQRFIKKWKPDPFLPTNISYIRGPF